MSGVDWQAIVVSVRLAAVVTGILLALGLPLAWWLTFRPRRWTFLIEAVVALPLVLPPTVLGFYVLDCDSLEHAIEWVMRCPNPMMEDSDIEIRPVFTMEDFGEAMTPELREQEDRLRAETASH